MGPLLCSWYGPAGSSMAILGPPSSTPSGRYFFGPHTYGQVPLTQDNVLGAVSLIFWSLLLLITLKYICFVLYADDHGEGGVFALLGLLDGVKYRGAGSGDAACSFWRPGCYMAMG